MVAVGVALGVGVLLSVGVAKGCPVVGVHPTRQPAIINTQNSQATFK